MGDDSDPTGGQASDPIGPSIKDPAASPPDRSVPSAAVPSSERDARRSIARWAAEKARAAWERDLAWYSKVGVVVAFIGVVTALIGLPFVVVAGLRSADGAPASTAGGPTGVATGTAPTPASPLAGARDEECALTRLPTSATANDFALCMLARGANGEMKKDSVNYPFGLTQVYVTYRNTGTIQQDDVIFRVKLPSGFSLVPGTTVAFNSLTPEGFRASDNVLDVGLNLGSYAPGASLSLYFEVQAAEPKAFYCGDNVGAATFTVTIASSVKATGSVMTVLRSCVS